MNEDSIIHIIFWSNRIPNHVASHNDVEERDIATEEKAPLLETYRM
jgi:hypothetical protein